MAAQWRPAGVGAERSSAMRLCNDQEGPTAQHGLSPTPQTLIFFFC